jgi:hypothetical protein
MDEVARDRGTSTDAVASPRMDSLSPRTLVDTRMDSLSPRTLVGYDSDDSIEDFLYTGEEGARQYDNEYMENFRYRSEQDAVIGGYETLHH